MNKKTILFILFLFSCSISGIAQTSYYYYKGKKFPLIINESKICVSILREKEDIKSKALINVIAIDTIIDNDYDIFTINKSDLSKLNTLPLVNDDGRSIMYTPCYKTTEGVEVFSTPYLNVRLKKEEDINLLLSFADENNLRIIEKDKLMPLWYILSITPKTSKTALDIANMFSETNLFTASIPDLCSKNLTCSNDSLFYLQWGLQNNNYLGVDISIIPAWNYSTGKNIKIAVLDTGIDMTHIDLSSNISNISYDTETNSSPSGLYGGHGTHCAGIAAAVKDNNIQIAGVAPEATLISISNTLTPTTNDHLKLANGIIWAYQHGADIISNSWGYPTPHFAIDEAIHNAFQYGRQGKGCVVVFASGNSHSSTICYPANCNDTILAVGAIDNTGIKADISNYGEGLDLVAPGVNILSTYPNNTTGSMSGTSMACPHVAGVAALILERNSELTVNQVNSIINRNAKKLSGVSFNISKPDGLWNNQYGYGLVDAYNSVLNTPSTIYIQNDTITGNRVFSADSIFIGNNVTDDKPYGDVYLDQGQITIKAKSLVIKNSTTIPLGTTLTIDK